MTSLLNYLELFPPFVGFSYQKNKPNDITLRYVVFHFFITSIKILNACPNVILLEQIPNLKSYLFIISLVVALFGVAAYTDFAIINNDFLQILKVAQFTDWKNLSTYYNGIYPTGFIFLVQILSFLPFYLPSVFVLLNLISFLLLAYVYFRQFTNGMSHWAMTIFLGILVLDTHIFQYIISPGAYIPFVASITISLIFLAQGLIDDKKKHLVLGILFMLIATQLRFHGIIIFGLVVVISTILKVEKRNRVLLLGGLILALILLFFPSWVATGNLIKNDHSMLVKLVDWSAVNPYFEYTSVSYKSFVQYYINNFFETFVYILPFLAFLILGYSNRKLSLIAYTLLMYYTIIKFHSSGRGILPVIPFSFYFAVYILNSTKFKSHWNLLPRISRYFIYGFASLVLVKIALGGKLQTVSKAKSQSVNYSQIESVIKEKYGVVNAENIYTNNFDFYLLHDLPHTPYTNGGWAKLNTTTYTSRPNPRLNSVKNLIQDLKHFDVRLLLIDQKELQKQTSRFKTLEVLKYLPSSELVSAIDSFDDNKYKLYLIK